MIQLILKGMNVKFEKKICILVNNTVKWKSESVSCPVMSIYNPMDSSSLGSSVH